MIIVFFLRRLETTTKATTTTTQLNQIRLSLKNSHHISFLQLTMLVLDILSILTNIWAIGMRSPLGNIFNVNWCWIMQIVSMYRIMKQVLGSFFMACYRVLCLKRRGMKSLRRRKIVNQLLRLEQIITVFLLGSLTLGQILW